MFVEEYLRELRAERFHPAACARYVARCWAKGRHDAALNPPAARSILLLGLALFGTAFLCSVGLAVAVDLGVARRTLTATGLWLIPITGALVLHVGLLRDRDGYPLSAINLPTALTVARLAVIPALVLAILEGHWRSAFWIFVVGELSDVVDGWLARRQRQETRLGTVLDPITDICFHLALFVALGAAGRIGPPALALAVVRYGGLLVGGAYLYLVHGPVRIQATLAGKATGFVLGVLLGFLLLEPAYGSGTLGPVLTPLARDGLVVLLAGSVLHAAVMGWLNLRYASAAAEEARQVIRDVRFGAGRGEGA